MTHDIPYEPMSQAELRDLSREAGRTLTEAQAQAYRRRKLFDQSVSDMLEDMRQRELTETIRVRQSDMTPELEKISR
jgi:hypothetical protein